MTFHANCLLGDSLHEMSMPIFWGKKEKKIKLSSADIATDKALFFIWKLLISFLFLNENICCGYSLEVPQWGTSNKYPQHMFSLRNKKIIMWIPPLICSYVLKFLASMLTTKQELSLLFLSDIFLWTTRMLVVSLIWTQSMVKVSVHLY